MLGRELIGLANRTSTYRTRVLSAALVLGMAAVGSLRMPEYIHSGAGRSIMDPVEGMLICLVIAIVPAHAAATAFADRESGTWSLVLVSGMSRGQFVVQYWLGRAIVGSTILVTALPVFALAYTYGGVGAPHLWTTVAGLELAVLQACAVGMACGCRYGTLAAAIGACYSYLAMVYLLTPIPLALLNALCDLPIDLTAGSPIGLLSWSDSPSSLRLVCDVLLPLVAVCAALLRISADLRRTGGSPPAPFARRSYAVAAGLQQRWVRRSGVVDPRATVLAAIEIPILWRERRRGAVADQRLMRIVLVAAVPVLAFQELTSSQVPTHALMIAALMVCAGAAIGMVPRERASMSLAVLLTTPVPANVIVRQKAAARMAVVRRCQILLVLAALERAAAGIVIDFPGPVATHLQGLAVDLSAAAFLPPAALWLGMWAGLRSASVPRAIAFLCLVVLTFLVLPQGVLWALPAHGTLAMALSAVSPLHLLPEADETALVGPASAWLLAAIWPLAIWPCAALSLRCWCLVRAERLLLRQLDVE